MESVMLIQLTEMMQEVKEMALLIDDSNKIIFINEQACKKLKLKLETVQGVDFFQIFNYATKLETGNNFNLDDVQTFLTSYNDSSYKVDYVAINHREDNYKYITLTELEENDFINKHEKDLYWDLPLGLVVTDIDGYIKYSDRKFTVITGLDENKIRGEKIGEIFPDEGFYIQKLLMAGKHELGGEIIKLLDGKGGYKYLYVDVLCITDNKELLYWLFRDASIYKDTTIELQQKEQYLSSILRAAPVGIGVLLNRKIYFANHGLVQITGFDVIEMLGNQLEMLFADSRDNFYIFSNIEDPKNNKLVLDFETKWITKNYEVKDILLKITPINPDNAFKGYTFTALDITERKKAKKALTISEDKYRNLVENAADAIIIFQSKDGYIINVNKQTYSLLGYEPDELQGEHISIIFPIGKDLSLIRKNISKEWIKTNPVLMEEVITKDGTLKTVEINNSFYEDSEGTLIIGFLHDMTDRISWEKKLAESEIRYRMLFNSVKEGIAIVDPVGFSVQIVNNTLCNLLGYKKNELINHPISKLFSLTDITGEEFENLTQIKDRYFQNVLCIKSNRDIIYVDLRTSIIQIDDKQYTAFYIYDVTERYQQQLNLERINREVIEQKDKFDQLNKQLSLTNKNVKRINKELKKSRDEFKLLFNEMVSGFSVHEMIYDSNGQSIDYKFISVNPAFERLTGLNAKNIIGKTVREVMPGVDESWIEKYGQVAKTGNPISYLNYSKELGKHFDAVAYSPGKDIFAVVFNDVTQRVTSRVELNKIFNLSLDLICMADFDGYLKKTNPAFQSTLGYSEQELKLKKYYEIIYEEDRTETEIIVKRELRRGESVINFQNRLITKNNKLVWLSWTIQPISQERTIFAIGRDITDQKSVEKELTDARQKAIDSDKIKSAFLANMSHEVRTPMNAIIGFSMLLDNEELTSTKRKKYTGIIRNRCDDLLRIIDDILDISRIEAGELDISPIQFSLDQLLYELFEVHKQRLEMVEKSEIELKISSTSHSVKVYNDRGRLIQVLNNLLDNAIKFTNEGSINFGYTDNENAVLFFVKDTGVGIQKEKHDVIFERFRQAEENLTRKFGGNGLGLAISKALVELMGGEIWFDSEEGHGSTFYFTIDKQLEIREIVDIKSLYHKRILIIEDDRHSVDYLRILLEGKGVILIHARTGEEALNFISQSKPFDIIFIDVQLTDINGIEVTKEIRKTDSNTPIIAKTAYAREGDKKLCLEAGCNDYLSKPVEDNKLLEMLGKYIKIEKK